ncbi:MAG: DUF4019 domain-containing protein [Thermodesulfobacteriota bacterium]
MVNPNADISEREKWDFDKGVRERELNLREAEIEIARQESTSSQWRNPLVLAIFAAAIAAAGNAVVAVVNGNLQRDLEDQKSEQTRILEVIKVGGNPDKAAENLDFLLKAGLIRNPVQVNTLSKFLAERKPGTGPSLPSSGNTTGSNVDPANRDASEKAAANILSMLAKKQYYDLWDSQISDWFKRTVTKEAFIANMTLGRARIGELVDSKTISNDFSDFDPSSGYKGTIHSVTFLNTYTNGKFFERIVVIKEKDGSFRLAGIWGDDADMKP